MKSKIGSGLADFAGGFLKQYISIDIGALAAFFGDQLHNF